MYLYILSCLNSANHEPVILAHSQRFSEGQFRGTCYKALIKSATELSEEKYIGEIFLEGLIKRAGNILVRDWAFKRVEIMTATYPSTGRLETKEDFDCLEFSLPEDLEERIIVHNQRAQEWTAQESERLLKYMKDISQR